MSQQDELQETSQAVLICKDPQAVAPAKQVFEAEGYSTLIWEVGQPCALGKDSTPAVILFDSAAATIRCCMRPTSKAR